MSKRNLNRRQRWRIEKIQAERVARSQKRQAQLDADVATTLGDTRPGLVTAHYGRKVEISGTDGVRQRCHFRANLEQLVVGDQVLWQPAEGPGDGVVTAIVPRTSVLKRPDNYGKLKPVAANVDLMLIVFAPAPTPSSQLLDRYLVAAELSGIRPALVLNKADLVNDDNRAALTALCDIYRKLDYPVIEASATDTGSAHAAGLAALNAALDGHTSVFVGQSGVGKSSLVNALLPDADIATNVLSDVSGTPLAQTLGMEALVVALQQVAMAQVWLIVALIALVTGLTGMMSRAWITQPLLLLGAILMVVPLGLTGHSSSGGNHDHGTNSYLWHLIFLVIWIGGLMALLAHGRRLGPDLNIALRRYSTIALVSIIIMAVSGLVNAAIRIELTDLLTTRYGLIIVAKTIGVIILGVFGWIHRAWVIPQV